jgi:hypothetical protein
MLIAPAILTLAWSQIRTPARYSWPDSYDSQLFAWGMSQYGVKTFAIWS